MTLMSRTSGPKTDFRDAAVAASDGILSQWRQDSGASGDAADPVESGFSYCVKADADGRSVMRQLKRKTLAALILAFGLIIFAIFPSRADSLAKKRGTPYNETALVTLGACGVLGGMTALFYGVTVHSRLVRRVARDRISVEREGASRPTIITIEDGQTFEKPKAVPEDIGAVILHPASRCIQIEGVTHRYMIHADDVLEADCRKTPTSRALVIEYAIGATSLRVALFDLRLSSEFKRQTIGGRNKLFDRILAVLESDLVRPIEVSE
jgi:hypothetical protein